MNIKAMFKIKIRFAALALGLMASVGAYAQNTDQALELLHVQGKVYLIAGGGGNTAIHVGEQGVVVVDTKLEGMGEALLAVIEEVSDKPIRWVVNTHVHPDHIGNNALLAQAGSNVEGDPADVFSHIGVMADLVTRPDPMLDGLPNNTYLGGTLEFYANGESVQLIHQPAAHTDGDSFVFFRNSNVLMTGDIFTTTGYPFIDVANGGSVQGTIDALNRALQLVIPGPNQQGGTLVIPGHGRITDEYELVNYRDMLTIIYERIANAIEQGMSLDEVKAAGLSRDYDPRFGSDSGFWTTEDFIETIYAEISAR